MSKHSSYDLKKVFDDAARQVRRMPVHACGRCWGKGVATYEVDNGGGWDRLFEEMVCLDCGGKGTVGGGQPGLHIWFQSIEERDKFKAKLFRMRGINWADEESDVLETQTIPRWENS